jgi:hypothetical protein
MKKLRDVLPYEFEKYGEYIDTPAYKLLDVKVTERMDGCETRWPGKHVHVYVWWKLANGKAVGFNENPAIGWSFPVITLK